MLSDKRKCSEEKGRRWQNGLWKLGVASLDWLAWEGEIWVIQASGRFGDRCTISDTRNSSVDVLKQKAGAGKEEWQRNKGKTTVNKCCQSFLQICHLCFNFVYIAYCHQTDISEMWCNQMYQSSFTASAFCDFFERKIFPHVNIITILFNIL